MKSREINKKRAMGPASFDEILEKITAPTLTTENWDGILTFCDHINSYSEGAKLGLKSLRKRLNHRDPHVILMAISVLDSCWANCGERFRKEVSSAQFINELKALSTNSQRLVSEKTRVTLQKWVENECKTDQSLSLIVSLVKTLKEDGYSFVVEDPKKKSQTAAMAKYSNDPNFVSSAQEEEEIAKAIAASLADAEKQDKLKKNTTSLYPATKKSSSASNLNTERKVRALYDFEAAESNELSFVSGDIITITDESNPHWWTGKIGNQIGLFPSSFVTNDIEDSKLKNAATSEKTPEVVASINEATLVQCLNVLHECDPTGERADPPELAQLEAASYAQRPLIDAHLASIDHQSNSLAQIDIAIRDVLALYDDAIQKGGYPQSQSIYAPHIAPSPHHQQQQYAYPPQPNPYQQYQNGQAQPIPQQQQQQPFFSQYGGQQPIQQQQQQQYYSQSNPQQSQPPPPPPPPQQQQQWTAPQTQQF